MSYRAQSRRVRPTRGRNGNGSHSNGNHSFAGRVALARAMSRPAKRGGTGMVPLVVSLFALGIVVILATSGVVGAGTVTGLIEQYSADLPDVRRFENIRFAQPSRIYDRTGTVELAHFQAERRDVVTFEEIPEVVLDATIATEDRSFWENEGYDIEAIVAAGVDYLAGEGDRGGASTITQQFVRAPQIGMLPAYVLEPGFDDKERKVKEIIQADRLTKYVTEAFGFEEGKRRIITAYLNQIFYGHSAYGISAAADVYFGKTLRELTLAQAALLAGLPKSPSTLDPFEYAEEQEDGTFIVETCGSDPPQGCVEAPPIARRNVILHALADGFGRWTTVSESELEAALDEPVVLPADEPTIFTAPHFVWAVKDELELILSDREPIETGGYKIITSLDMEAQKLAERYIEGATIVAQLRGNAFDQAIEARHLRRDRNWISVLQGKNMHNGAMTAVDYRTGDVLAYVGSAGYYRDDLRSKKFDPKFDVAQGYRQPGSAWKPIMYATGIDERAITAGTVLLDVTTAFAPTWQPKNADLLDRGPVRVRKALQYSLNIPAIRALERVGAPAVAERAERAGISLLRPSALEDAGLAGAIGTVEVQVLELTAAFGGFGNQGVVNPPRMVLQVTDDAGEVLYEPGEPAGREVWSPQAAWIMADILASNTNPRENLIWGPLFDLHNGPGGAYRPLALKTGTTDGIKDLTTFGLLAEPRNPDEPAIAVGVWMGNSDRSRPTGVLFGIDGPARVFHAFMRDYSAGKPVANFQRPNKGLVEATIDAWSGGRPGEWTRDTAREWFINGTQPGSRNAIDPPGLLYRQACGGEWYVDPLKAEKRGVPDAWRTAVADWTARARNGTGVRGRYGTLTAHVLGYGTWGGPIIPSDPTACEPQPTPSGQPEPTDEPEPTDRPRRTERPDPTDEPQPTRTPRPTRPPTPEPTPEPTPRPDPCERPNPPPRSFCDSSDSPSPTAPSPSSSWPL